MSTSLIETELRALRTNTLTPRSYQIEAMEAVRQEFRSGRRRTAIILPTGTGKTVLFACIARSTVERGRRVLIMAHREELVTQAADTIERVGILPGVERAESFARTAFDPDVVVASVQTISGRKRLASWPKDYFDLIVIDEAHHAVRDTYLRVLAHFEVARVIGVTATPDRADGEEIASVFGTVAYERDIWWAMTAPGPEGPYLCRLKVVRCETEIDLRGLRTKNGDYNDDDLAERIGPLVETLANAVKSKIGDRQTIVFTPDCGSASAMATALSDLGVKADYVWGSSLDREAKIAAYKRGEIQVLCNCMLLTEGFDAPRTSAVVLLRPTKSRPLYAQMVGRGTRLADGKEDCLLVDFAWLTDSHDLVRPSDLFDRTDRSDDEGAALDDLLVVAHPEGIDLVEATKQAREEGLRRQEVRVKAKAREVRMKWVSYDPLSAADALGIKYRGGKDAVHDPPTEGQLKMLRNFGVSSPDSISRRRAKPLLDALVKRSRAGLATHKQLGWLIDQGVDPESARSMSKAQASAKLSELWGTG